MIGGERKHRPVMDRRETREECFGRRKSYGFIIVFGFEVSCEPLKRRKIAVLRMVGAKMAPHECFGQMPMRVDETRHDNAVGTIDNAGGWRRANVWSHGDNHAVANVDVALRE